jgi:hypothetical protein
MDQHALIQNIWIILLIWSLFYLGDYYLTILSARIFRGRLSDHVHFEGSFELTPQFQKDIDSLRMLSPQFLIRWLGSLLVLYLIWWLSTGFLGWPQIFYFLIGGLLLRESGVHLRHMRNLALHVFTQHGGLEGRIRYKRWLMLRLSGAEFLGFGFFFLLLGIFLGSWFFMGGAVGCWVVTLQQWRLSKEAFNASQGADQASEGSQGV